MKTEAEIKSIIKFTVEQFLWQPLVGLSTTDFKIIVEKTTRTIYQAYKEDE